MKEKGFTLVETLITLAIGVVVGAMLLVIMFNTGGLFYKESSKVNEGLSTNDALSEVKSSIKDSSAVAVSYTWGSTTYTSSPAQLVLKVPSIDTNSNILSNTFDYFVFFSDQTELRFRSFPDAQSSRKSADQILSTSLDSLKFQYFDSSGVEVTPASAIRVKITLTLKQKAGATYETNSATSEANLRND